MAAVPEFELLRRAYERAVSAAQPAECLPPALSGIESQGPALVLGAGKAAAAMAAVFASCWRNRVRGLVVTRYGHGLKPGEDAGQIEIVEAGHPSPDSASLAAGARLLDLAASMHGDEQLIWLVSGGGSALAAAPLPPLTVEQKRNAANYLISAGADIREINCVRKHLSGLKGGRLASVAHPHRVTTIAISDVPGDDIADIASGPTIPDPTSQRDAIAILDKYQYPDRVELLRALEDARLETPGPEDRSFADDRHIVIATAATAMQAAAALLESEGYEVVYLGDDLADEAHVLGREHAEMALRYRGRQRRIAILSGGETRVVLQNPSGRGGRNLEYLAGLALGLGDVTGVYALAADTDGIDGNGGHAGAVLGPGMTTSSTRTGRTLAELLIANDCYEYFADLGTLLICGPTRTNVNDFRLILCTA